MVSPPSGSCARVDLGMVRMCDRLDDGESQSVAVVVAGAGAAHRWKGWKRRWISSGGMVGPVFVIVRNGMPVAGAGGDLEVSSGDVVADRVVD